VEAILGGAVTAGCWAVSTLSSSRSARRIGALSTLAWVMVVGLAVSVPIVAVGGVGQALTTDQVVLLAIAGISNVVGLLFGYSALRLGKVAVVAPIMSTEGALGAVIAIAAGEPLAAASGVVLALIALGVLLTATEVPEWSPAARNAEPVLVPAGLALAAAACFGVNLYVSGRIGIELSVAWAVLPARVAGAVVVAVPLLLTGRATLTRQAVPFVVISGILEVAGIAAFALAARGGIAVSSVVASQFAAIAAVVSVLLFHERLARHQLVGVTIIATGVAVLTAIQG